MHKIFLFPSIRSTRKRLLRLPRISYAHAHDQPVHESALSSYAKFELLLDARADLVP
jgi:hypothetical protein